MYIDDDLFDSVPIWLCWLVLVVLSIYFTFLAIDVAQWFLKTFTLV